MTDMQHQTLTFIESECNSIGLPNAAKSLCNGYTALCEAENNQSSNKVDEWELMPKVLYYLREHGYYIEWRSGNRNVSSDGWYELGYYLRNENDPNFELYLNTHYDHDQDFEDEWESRDGDEVQPEDIIWDHIDDYWRGFEHILEDDTVRNLLPPEMVSQMQYCLDHKSN
jgi:hypothetical protein